MTIAMEICRRCDFIVSPYVSFSVKRTVPTETDRHPPDATMAPADDGCTMLCGVIAKSADSALFEDEVLRACALMLEPFGVGQVPTTDKPEPKDQRPF